MVLIFWGLFTTWALAELRAKTGDAALGQQFIYEGTDLVWQKRPFIFQPGNHIRYIDFVSGDDSNEGSRESPWKHHPWDKNATGKVARSKGIDTYVFKRGVTYRGSLVAMESGEQGNPIQLTGDPSWGKGDAVLSGAQLVTEAWEPCKLKTTTGQPMDGQDTIWCTSLDRDVVPRLVWEVREDSATRIPIARMPDWAITNVDDPRSEWAELTGVVMEFNIYVDHARGFKAGDSIRVSGVRKKSTPPEIRVIEVASKYIRVQSNGAVKKRLKQDAFVSNGHTRARITGISATHEIIRHLSDSSRFTQSDPAYFKGATLWVEKASTPKPVAEKVIDYNPAKNSLGINLHLRMGSGPHKYNRYFLEGLPQFLDSAGEYYFAETGPDAGKIYLRLPADRDPNNSVIAVARHPVILQIRNKSHIRISGLTFRFSNQVEAGTREARHAALYASAIQVKGSSRNIYVQNCRISQVSEGIVVFPAERQTGDVIDNIVISDNEFYDIDGAAIAVGNGRSHYAIKNTGARLVHVKVLRNRLSNIGYRALGNYGLGSHGHGINVSGGELVEVAGNHVDRVWGAGILVFNGAEFSVGRVSRPLIRTLIHHNKVTNSLLGLQDFGGISSWMGGPSYIFNNISGNPVGCKYADYRSLLRRDWYRRGCYGVGIYLDGQYKSYTFNNIIWGKNNNVNDRIYNSVAINEAMGFMNMVFNNTIYRFGVGLHKGMLQHNRSYYLGNLMQDIGNNFIRHEPVERVIEYDTLAYSRNIFSGTAHAFGRLGISNYPTLKAWQDDLRKKKPIAYDTGRVVSKEQLIDAAGHDFRPRASSQGIDQGVKVFVPWGLYGVVGEWNFYRRPANPSIIIGENINLNREWVRRGMFQDVERNSLECHNVDASSFKNGILEDWVAGALHFNGVDQYCELDDSKLKGGYSWRDIKKRQSGEVAEFARETVDIDRGNFLIEIIFRTRPGLASGGLVAKRDDNGYLLAMDASGAVRLTLDFGDKSCSRLSAVRVNDGEWHHIIAEVDRSDAEGITFYVDGRRANGHWSGQMSGVSSLSNSGDFLVGVTAKEGGDHLSGDIDFLRISRGTLADAETTIEELYNWEFDGPFLRDFTGQYATGARRDVGAIEYRQD